MSEIEKFHEEVPQIQKSKFYTYTQNNSGGSFVDDEDAGIAQYVIVEAFDAREADSRAKSIGLYFDGYGDCECCGSRWDAASNSWGGEDGKDAPMIYNQDVSGGRTTHGFTWGESPDAFAYIHYLSGQRTAVTGYTEEEKTAMTVAEKNAIDE